DRVYQDLDGDGILDIARQYLCTWSGDGLTQTCEEDAPTGGIVEDIRTRTYDQDGRLVLERKHHRGVLDEEHRYTYNADGDLIEEYMYWLQQGVDHHRRRTWDGRGHLLWEASDLTGDDIPDSQTWWDYDAMDNLIEKRVDRDGDGDTDWIAHYDYHPDGSIYHSENIDPDDSDYGSFYRSERDTTGTLRYAEDGCSDLLWAYWADEHDTRYQTRLAIPPEGLDITFPTLGPRGQSGNLGGEEFAGIRPDGYDVYRPLQGWAHLALGSPYLDETTYSSDETWYASGQRRTQTYHQTHYPNHSESRFLRSGLVAYTYDNYTVGNYGTIEETGTLDQGRAYHYTYALCEYSGYEYDCHTIVTDTNWTCP
ncbi:MAG: hypothetical protein JXX28_12795, partial [Deltaproteobacteria bacterium]|nr:hypothetical protein [Deltaproteobacteria bacterium]